MSDFDQQVREVYENTQCGIYEPWESLRPGTQLFYTIFASQLRKQWEAEQGAKMAPIAGPPDLDGVPDEALFLWTLRGEPLATSWTIATALELRTARISDIIWHIPLGVIELPANIY